MIRLLGFLGIIGILWLSFILFCSESDQSGPVVTTSSNATVAETDGESCEQPLVINLLEGKDTASIQFTSEKFIGSITCFGKDDADLKGIQWFSFTLSAAINRVDLSTSTSVPLAVFSSCGFEDTVYQVECVEDASSGHVQLLFDKAATIYIAIGNNGFADTFYLTLNEKEVTTFETLGSETFETWDEENTNITTVPSEKDCGWKHISDPFFNEGYNNELPSPLSSEGDYCVGLPASICPEDGSTGIIQFANPLDLSNYKSGRISVDVYHTPLYASFFEQIYFQYSLNNTDWQVVGPPILRYQAGDVSEWKTHVIGFIPAMEYVSSVYLRLIGVSDYGQDSFVDNIILEGCQFD